MRIYFLLTLLLPISCLADVNTDALTGAFGSKLCKEQGYHCIIVKKNESWASLFPDESQRELVQKLNRSYNRLGPGKEIAIPDNLAQITIFDISPFPLVIADEEKQVIIDQVKIAWAAYEDGKLVNWGPISSGRDKCTDSANSCLTKPGAFRIFSKEGFNCKSDIFPIGKGGARMPYCMYFHKGFAMHGSDDMPGYRASHGCVRMFVKDAKWLNNEFTFSTSEKNEQLGTKVVVLPVYKIGDLP
jgi:L,D-transpeptidase catalytic domain